MERDVSENERVWTPDMGEISGFGGGYEATCRAMVLGGLAWFDEHPDAAPQFHGYKNVTGICIEDNEDAKALSEAIVSAAPDRDCTGAMHQAAVSHVMFIRNNGWAEYARQLREREAKEAQEAQK